MTESQAPHTIRRVQSWYGVPAEIAVENGLWHLVRVGRLSLHHPPLVNLALRWGLPHGDRLYLSFLHEFGHLQTLPITIGHILLLLLRGHWPRRSVVGKLRAEAAAIIAHEAVWELSSELYMIAATGPAYFRIYRQHPQLVGQVAFWGGMSAVAASPTLWLIATDDG